MLLLLTPLCMFVYLSNILSWCEVGIYLLAFYFFSDALSTTISFTLFRFARTNPRSKFNLFVHHLYSSSQFQVLSRYLNYWVFIFNILMLIYERTVSSIFYFILFKIFRLFILQYQQNYTYTQVQL